jgi:hypothetical protein
MRARVRVKPWPGPIQRFGVGSIGKELIDDFIVRDLECSL